VKRNDVFIDLGFVENSLIYLAINIVLLTMRFQANIKNEQ